MAGRRLFLTALVVVMGALLGMLLASHAAALSGSAESERRDATIVLFHGDGCPHCAAERTFLAEVVARHPGIVVEEHEVWYDADGRDLLLRTAEELGFEPVGVPVTVVGDRFWIGFDAAIGAQIEQAALSGAPPGEAPGNATAGENLLAATLAIAFVDGVNPCSLWVLSLLLAMVLHHGSRGRVLVVGGVFLVVTAAMYGLYLLGLYSAASYLSGMEWLRLVVALVAGTFGVLQLKDGLGIRHGPTLSISAARRPGLYARMRTIASPQGAFAATLAGTVALAVAVSLLETPCTAGLPLLWTTMLAEQGVGTLQAAGLFAVYLSVFLLDELVVFTIAVVTLRSTRLQERHGRALKLVAGSVLMSLAAAMLVWPTALATLGGTLAVFTGALVLAFVLYVASSGRWSASSSASPSTSRTTE